MVVYRLISSPGAQNQGMALAAGVVLAVGRDWSCWDARRWRAWLS
ncbi:hypothetical protein [Actinomyces lilanjuaniae]|nr:hypothetical protein [Actinomyces lilanjuaniae]